MKCKVLLAPSRADTFCVPVLEAMSAGVIPLITQRVGAKTFVEKTQAPDLVVRMNTDAIAKEAVAILKMDLKSFNTLSMNAKKIAKQWNSKESSECFTKTILSLT